MLLFNKCWILVVALQVTLGQGAKDVLLAICGDPVEQDVELVHLTKTDVNCFKPSEYPHDVNGPTGAIVNGELIVCGGFDNFDFDYSNKCFNYDVEFDQWNETTAMIERRLRPMSVMLDQNRWWITGGTSEGEVQNSTEIYENGQFVEGPRLPSKLFNHCLVQINATHTFVGGGYDENSLPQANSYIYDWTSDTWTEINPLFQRRAGQGCALINRRGFPEIVVAGGNFLEDLDTVEILNLSNGLWQIGPTLPYPLTDATFVDTGEKIVLAGGYSSSFSWMNTLLELDQNATTWTPMEQSMVNGRSRFIGLTIEESLANCM